MPRIARDRKPDETTFLRRVFDQISDCLVAIDLEGRVVLINKAYCELLGGPESEFLGRHITDVVGPRTRLHVVAQGGRVELGYPLDVKGRRLVTKQVPVLLEGEVIGAVGMALTSDLRIPASKSRTSGEKAKNDAWHVRFSLNDIFGEAREIVAYKQALVRAAEHEFPVLITGETGTGKELGAQSIHHMSLRSSGPFVWVNCSSIPQELIEAELFGYEGGAFTGARSQGKPGKFELSANGTIFLDEIGDMPLALQSSLLRVLQTNEYVRVGGTTPLELKARIICATNKPLGKLVADKSFRSDLFYRLDIEAIEAPTLRSRQDKEELAQHLLRRAALKTGRSLRPLGKVQLDRIRSHDWPGNARELENVLLRWTLGGDFTVRPHGEASHSPGASLREQLEDTRRRAVQNALLEAGGDKERCAAILGISRAALYKELAKSTD
jgi:transcriptional regulator with PAS, ATPase and Fis domain